MTIYRQGFSTKNQAPTKYNNISIEIRNHVKVVVGEKSRKEFQAALELKHIGNFKENNIDPTLDQEIIQMKYPDSPNHPKQGYLLTEKGKEILKNL